MNILLTTVCNRRCRYCFASEKVVYKKGGKGHYITLENLERIVEFLKGSDDRISLLGGEPTIHPRFDDIVRYLQGVVTRVNIFTNGILPEKSLRALEKTDPKQFHLTVNVNEPLENKPSEWKRVLEVFKRIPEHTGLGFNIYRTDFDAEFLVALCVQHNLSKTIRLGLAQPVVNEKNDVASPGHYPLLGKRIVQFSEVCDRQDISLGLDCGFVMCMFTERQLGKLVVNNVRLKFVCGPAVDIGPDLTIWSCFPFSQIHNTHLEKHKTVAEVYAHFRDKLKHLYLNGIYDRCSECKYLFRQQCSGGCAAHIYNRSLRSS